ncbi:Ferredoxin-NADP reductase [Streptomyces sp. MnatMP-M27]|nr:Ferredoxin-NADP reductase [Streptomyces sp. MnatMP-M27]
MSEPRFPVVVTATWTAARHVLALDMAADSDRALPGWTPGSHVTIHTPAGSCPLSLCGRPADDYWRLGVRNREDGAARWLHDNAAVGTSLEVSSPLNTFGIDPDSDNHILIAGGVGITPILAMALELAKRKSSWRLLYIGSSRQEMAFLDHLRGVRERVTVWETALRGRPNVAALVREWIEGPSATLYCCGPTGLIESVSSDFSSHDGVRVISERFAAAPELDGSFEIELGRSGERVRVPAGVSVLDVLEERGVDIPWSCRAGICGTCETPLIAGQTDHGDSLVGMTRAADVCFPCVVRAVDDDVIVLDI